MPMFDIPNDRLVDLTDAELRELLARLCEAERERQGGHRNEVRWGGSQTAADGGLDVVVEPVGSFVPAGPLARRDAGIQVKAADLAAAAITDEMRYGGSLRPAISALAARSGSYLIASAGANCSEAMLRRRVDSMRAALADDPNGADLDLIFLDRKAISRWVSAHPSVAEQAPEVFLGRVFLDEADGPSIRFRDGLRPGPISNVPTEALIEWCRQNPDRWTRVAPQISPFSRGIDDEGETGQISPLAFAFLEVAPRPADVVEAYLQHLTPMSYSGSRAAIMERRLAVIESLQDHPAPEVGHTISRLAPDIRARIDHIRQAEQEEDRERDQRFE